MFKKFLIGASAFATFIIIGIVGIGIYKDHESAQFSETAVPYIKSVIPEISKWDKDIFFSYLSAEAKKNINKEDMANVFKIFSRMGSLISYEEPEFTNSHSYDAASGKPKTIITYNVDAKYENGEALLKFTLIRGNETLALHNFNLQSRALLN